MYGHPYTSGLLAPLLLALLLAAPVRAQSSDDQLEAIASWVTVDVTTGYETRQVNALADGMPGWSTDPWGNLVLRVGSGRPRKLISCALDRPSYAASQITADGYLRLHRVGSGSRNRLWDQAHEAQQVRVLTERGPVAGVVARSNGHFAQQHRGDTAIVSADDLWVDVGASSADEVAALGIRLLDPVTRHLPGWTIQDAVVGPDAGRRGACAAVVTVGEAGRAVLAPVGETVFVLSAQQVFGWVGLSSFVSRADTLDQVVIVAPGETVAVRGARAVDALGGLGAVLFARGISAVRWIAPAVRDPGAAMEILSRASADVMLREVAAAAGIQLATQTTWVPAPERAEFLRVGMDSRMDPLAGALTRMVELHSVPGHEWAVRRHILEALPGWARQSAQVDDMGNVIVAAGPDRDTTVFMAHMDEVGYEVESISADGVVTLATRGGAVSSAWEGQTALLHFDPPNAPSLRTGQGADISPRWREASLEATAPGPLRGVFLTRDEPTRKDPGTLRAWFGLDAAGLAKLGAEVGAAVTSHKEGLRLSARRFTARALDDRAGSTALLLAVQTIDPAQLLSKVIFTWSVGEEGGLRGAEAMARRFASSARRIYSVDTFVSSDTPLESPHFAYAPLGQGPVLRAIENGGASPPAERARVIRIAEGAGIPLQIGLTQGGTDGTRFTFWGAPNQGLSWPGRYSHSPGEVLDFRDLQNLRDLIIAVASADGGS